MTTATYALGRPHPAALRGGDCRARDLNQARNVHGPHRFAASTHCQITNGLLRLTVGASGAAPSLAVEVWRGRVTVGDVYEDIYTDTYGGSIGTPAWFAVGTITIDSTLLTALLTAVRVVRITPEAVTVRLVTPVMADAFVTLRRGERMIHVQHGSTRAPTVSTSRRVRWTGSPSPTGTTSAQLVQEASPAVGLDGLFRFVGAIDTATVNASAFSSTASGVTTARFGAGVGTYAPRDGAFDLHNQLADASRPQLVVT